MLIVHGLDLSYFTGKLEGYLRAKGLSYRLEEMTVGSFRRLARHTGVQQMPQLELPDGRWMTDTVRIIDALEGLHALVVEALHAGSVRIDEEVLQVWVVVENRTRGEAGFLGNLVEPHSSAILGHGALRCFEEVAATFTALVAARLRPRHHAPPTRSCSCSCSCSIETFEIDVRQRNTTHSSQQFSS